MFSRPPMHTSRGAVVRVEPPAKDPETFVEDEFALVVPCLPFGGRRHSHPIGTRALTCIENADCSKTQGNNARHSTRKGQGGFAHLQADYILGGTAVDK